MYIPRLLVLPLLFSVCVAPVAAQSSLDRNPQPGIRLDQIIAPLEFRRPAYVELRAGERSDVTCYSLRSYRVTRDDPESDSTSPALFHMPTRLSVSAERRRAFAGASELSIGVNERYGDIAAGDKI